MRVLSESWCFCNGGGKSERLKASIFSSKSAAMARLSSSSPPSSSSAAVNSGTGGGGAGDVSGTGFLIHRSLLLTTHVNLPSVSAAESAEIRLQNGVSATLVPQRFFMTSSILDLTIVGLDSNDAESSSLTGPHHHQPHHLKICPKPNLDLGNAVYLLGYTHNKGELTIGEGKVVIATDNLIKLSTDGVTLSPGSAGFDSHGNLAFVVCDPMKLATSPNTNTKSSSTSTSSTTNSSWKKDLPLQFGIPMPVICDWLNQHWEGSLDELSKPKLPLMRLVSSGHHRSEHLSCASFTKRQVFKPSEGGENELTGSSSSNAASKSREQALRLSGGSAGSSRACEEDNNTNNKPAPADMVLHANPLGSTTHAQGIPSPEIYESPKVTAIPVRKKESPQPLLDINFPPRVGKFAVSPPQPANKGPVRALNQNLVEEEASSSSSSPREVPVPPLKPKLQQGVKNNNMSGPAPAHIDDKVIAEVESTGSVNIDDGAHSEVHSSSSPVQVSEVRDGQNSEVETMYSAETAESRNYTSPREVTLTRFNHHQQPVGRSQSCVNYNRWAVHKYPVGGRKSSSPLDKQRSFTTPRKTYSSGGGGATSIRSNEYLSPTVSSIMKKRSNLEQQSLPHPPPPLGFTPISSSHRARHSAVNSSPRWMF